jgi:GLPGLI family protein
MERSAGINYSVLYINIVSLNKSNYMKKNLTITTLIIALFTFLSFQTFAKEFKGVITYKITIEGSGVTDEMKAMMPKTMTMTVKGNKAKMEMIMSMGKTITISDGDSKTAISLMDMMGQKIAVESTQEEIMQNMAESPEVKVEVTSETKDILGYICKKAIITSEEEDMEMTVYFTEELGTKDLNFDNPQFKDINGLMMEFEMPNEMFSMHFTAVSIEKKNVDDSEFLIPEGYQVKTKEEMKGMFGGM